MSTSSTPATTPKATTSTTHTPHRSATKRQQHTPKPAAGSLRAAAVNEKKHQRQATNANDSQRSKKRQKRQDQRNTFKVAVDSPYHVSITPIAADTTEHVLQLLQQQFKQLQAKLTAVRKQITSARHNADLQRQQADSATIRSQRVEKPAAQVNAITIDVDNPTAQTTLPTSATNTTAVAGKAEKKQQRLERKQRKKAQKHEVQQLIAAEMGTLRRSGVLLGLNEVTAALTQLQQSSDKASQPTDTAADVKPSRVACVIVATQTLPTALLQHLPVQCCMTQTSLLPLACTSEKLGELLGLHRCIAVGLTADSFAGDGNAAAEAVKYASIPLIPWLQSVMSASAAGAEYVPGALVEQYPKR